MLSFTQIIFKLFQFRYNGLKVRLSEPLENMNLYFSPDEMTVKLPNLWEGPDSDSNYSGILENNIESPLLIEFEYMTQLLAALSALINILTMSRIIFYYVSMLSWLLGSHT